MLYHMYGIEFTFILSQPQHSVFWRDLVNITVKSQSSQVIHFFIEKKKYSDFQISY